MADATTRLGLPYPEGNDTPDVPADVQALTSRLDAVTLSREQGPLASRGPAGTAGRVYWATDAPESPMSYDDGVAWRPVPGPGLIPIGGVLDWQWSTEPPGPAVWLECDGRTVTRDAYPELLDAAGVAGASMVIPDRRGRTPMGAGQGPGLTNRAVGSLVGGEAVTLTVGHLPRHNHAASSNVVGNHDHGGVTGGGGAHDHSYTFGAWSAAFGYQAPADDAQLFKMLRAPAFPTGTTSLVGNHTHAIAPNGAHGHTITVDYTPNPTQAVPVTQPSTVTRYFVRAR